MKRIFIILCLAALAPVLSVAQSKEELEALENILPYWMNNAVDPDGGFYGFVSCDNEPRPQSSKGAILNASILPTRASKRKCFLETILTRPHLIS